MRNYVKVVALLGLGAATLSASGWRIPEQSLNSTALSAAYVAGANGADASYYNPANMMWMEDGSSMEMAFTYIKLPSIKYTDSATNPFAGGGVSTDASSTVENFYIPTFHYVSPFVNDFRFGLSMVAPGGLSKRWDDTYGKATAEEFTLTVIEINPTVAYRVNDKFSVGFGLRGVYSSGIVKSDATAYASADRDLEGDSIDFGYNLALSYRATDNLTLASTYRSKVDLTEEGTATLASGTYDGGASVTIPLPASLTLAAAYTISKTTVELVFERTYWSAYKELDFDYDLDLTTAFGGALAAFDNPIPKNWKDADAYRIGISHQYSDKLKLMAGFAIDKNGADKEHIGFELPESDAKLYSAGFEYKLNDKIKIGLSYLYDQKDSLTVDNATLTKPNPSGTFTDASAHLVTASFKYKF